MHNFEHETFEKEWGKMWQKGCLNIEYGHHVPVYMIMVIKGSAPVDQQFYPCQRCPWTLLLMMFLKIKKIKNLKQQNDIRNLLRVRTSAFNSSPLEEELSCRNLPSISMYAHFWYKKKRKEKNNNNKVFTWTLTCQSGWHTGLCDLCTSEAIRHNLVG